MDFASSRRRNPTARRVSPDFASLLLGLPVGVYGALEFFVFLTRNRRANSLQLRQMLLCLGQVICQEIGFTDVFVCMPVRRIKFQCFVVLNERGFQTSRLT